MTARGRPPNPTVDRIATLVVVFAFALGLGVATVTVPLVALDAGYGAATVGFLVAISASVQFAMRLPLPWLLGRFPDRTLIAMACMAMALAFALLLASTAVAAFVAAQVLQGTGRAIFWTSGMTHAVRGGGRSVERLVDMNMAGNTGTLVGPALGGMLAVLGLPVALATAIAASLVGAVATIALRRLPPYDRSGGVGTIRLLRREGVDVAVWASAVGGGWWAMQGSYVPVIGVAAGLGTAGIGWLITLSEGAGLVALIGLRRVPTTRIRPIVTTAAFIVSGALIGIGVVAIAGASAVVAFVPMMLLGGAANGAVTTLGPVMASLAARSEEQGDALALPGLARAGALLVAPAVTGALLSIVAVPAAVALVAGGLALPGILVGRGARGSGPTADDAAEADRTAEAARKADP